jgi:hypothetical protein
MRWLLFWVFLSVFVLASLGTLAMVFFGLGSQQHEERMLLIQSLIVATAASVVALFSFLFGIKKGGSESIAGPELGSAASPSTDSARLIELTNDYKQLKIDNSRLISELDELHALPARILGELGAGESLTIRELMERLEDTDVAGVQATLGRLLQSESVEGDPTRPAGSYRICKKNSKGGA